jgi:hypothetical protein
LVFFTVSKPMLIVIIRLMTSVSLGLNEIPLTDNYSKKV